MSRKILIAYFHLIIVLMSDEILSSSSLDMYTACSNKYTCGTIEADFPFVGEERLDGCGYPGLKLGCEDKDKVTITIEDVKYRVLELNSASNGLVIARVDFLDGICSPKHGNTSLDNELFEYGSEMSMDVTLVYDCPEEVNFLMPTEFECSDDEKGYVLLGNPGNNGGGACRSVVNARVVLTDNLLIDNTTFNVSVFEKAMSEGFDVKYKSDSEGCEKCRKSDGVCGYDAKLGHTTCYCSDRRLVSSVRTCSSSPENGVQWESPEKKSGGTRNLIIGIITAGVSGIVILSISIYYCRRNQKWRNAIIFWRRDERDEFDVEEFIRNYGSFAPKRYSYANVNRMTNSFAEKIGVGGYGSVYKGKLPDDRLVAVKMLNKCTGDGEEFVNEVASIGRTSHVNIVTLLGFCCEGKKRALIYEYMANGSLDRLIFNREASNTEHCSKWQTLYEIALGIARGLEYLHRGCNTTILHLDIKPQNILLDDDLYPKISDFGLAQLWLKKDKTLSMVGARGTIGYMAPEVFSRAYGRVSQKSDVYSFGMLVLEMVGGRKNFDSGVSRTSEIYFPNKVYKDMELGNEPTTMGETAEEKEVSMKMILVSFWCIQTNPADRPSMSKVMDMLQGSLESLEVPPKPYLFSPTRSPKGSSTVSFQDFAAETEQS